MEKFINDMFHMTEGEKLIEYWWLWLIIALVSLYVVNKNNNRQKG